MLMMNNDRESLIKEIKERYIDNMVFFKKWNKSLYEILSTHQATEFSIGFDEGGIVNLVNSSTQKPVYPEPPEIYARKQVDNFFKKARANRIKFHSEIEKRTGYIHDDMTENLTSLYSAQDTEQASVKDDFGFTLIINGIGAGFHIEALINELEPKSVVIVDKSYDALMGSMYFIDWKGIIKKLGEKKINLKIIIENEYEAIHKNLNEYFFKIGIFNIVSTYIFSHYHNKDLNNFLKRYLSSVSNMIFGMGFFDDEKVGLAHTIDNCNKGYPLSRISMLQRGLVNETPVLVVGNGPSLDKAEEFIRENKENIIIISCGTAISTLYKKGIKPDIHVEQERPFNTYEWLKNGTSDEYRKGIYFFGLNTVHPKVFSLFDSGKRFICSKPNDLGTSYIIKSLIPEGSNTVALADNCNPTVTNFGLSLCMLLGLNNIYLAGVDYGMPSGDEHHSKDSQYIGRKEIRENKNNKIVKSVDGGKVYTTKILDASRVSAESIIRKYHLSVKNLSLGAHIEGTEWISLDDTINLAVIDDKECLIEGIIKKSFNSEGFNWIDKEDLVNHLSREIHDLNKKIKKSIDIQVNDKKDVYVVLEKINLIMLAIKKDMFTYSLCKGSIYEISSIIWSVVCYSNPEDIKNVFEKAKAEIINFMNLQEKEFYSDFYAHDTYSNF